MAIAQVTNPSDAPMTVTLECTESLTQLQLAPRTTARVLLDPKDQSCEVRQ